MINFLCVKWGNKYSPHYVNVLYNMVSRNVDCEFKFFCYTEDSSGIEDQINIIPIQSDLEGWWLKLDLLDIMDSGCNILLDLDIVIVNRLDRLISTKTRTLSVIYSMWKEGFLQPTLSEKRHSTLYNSSIMKWQGNQGKIISNYFKQNKEYLLFKYRGIDTFLFNERVDVDILPSGIAYSYWKGARFLKDSTPEKLRKDYEICIVNHAPKPHEIDSWIKEYWC